jgi:methionine synthase II (cobalamin-independent)
MGIPTEVVGSLPRPTCERDSLMCENMLWLTALTDLQQAYADYDAGKIKQDELFKAQDKSVEDSLSNMAKTGETLITDGEQRASSSVF